MKNSDFAIVISLENYLMDEKGNIDPSVVHSINTMSHDSARFGLLAGCPIAQASQIVSKAGLEDAIDFVLILPQQQDAASISTCRKRWANELEHAGLGMEKLNLLTRNPEDYKWFAPGFLQPLKTSIDHVGLYVKDLEAEKNFYEEYFGAVSNDKYENPKKGFSSYFLSFPDGGCRLELMHKDLDRENPRDEEAFGLAHLCFKLSSKEDVDELAGRLKEAGYECLSGPRTTGDGYYEAVFADPEGNRVEISG